MYLKCSGVYANCKFRELKWKEHVIQYVRSKYALLTLEHMGISNYVFTYGDPPPFFLSYLPTDLQNFCFKLKVRSTQHKNILFEKNTTHSYVVIQAIALNELHDFI